LALHYRVWRRFDGFVSSLKTNISGLPKTVKRQPVQYLKGWNMFAVRQGLVLYRRISYP